MTTTLYKADGSAVQIPDEQVRDALASGEYGVDIGTTTFVGKSGKKHIIGPQGAQDLLKYIDSGGHIQTEEERQKEFYGQSPVKAAILGAARGLSFGTSDALLKMGGAEQEVLRGLEEANPIASAGGEVAGVVGSLLIPETWVGRAATAGKLVGAIPRGAARLSAITSEAAEGAALRALGKRLPLTGIGASLPASMEAGVGTRALAKAVGGAVGGATEGAAYGIGQAIHEKALGDERAMGEIVASTIGPAALLGGAGGALFGTVGELGSTGIRGLANKMIKHSETSATRLKPQLEQELGWRGAEALGLTPAQYKNLVAKKGGEKFRAKMVEVLTEDILGDGKPLLGGGSTLENQERLLAAREKAGKLIGDFMRDMDDKIGAAQAEGAALRQSPFMKADIRSAEQFAKMKDMAGRAYAKMNLSAPTIDDIWAKVKTEVVDELDKIPMSQNVKDYVGTIKTRLKEELANKKLSYEEWHKIQQRVQQSDMPWEYGNAAWAEGKIAGIIRKELRESAERNFKIIYEDPVVAGRAISNLRAADKIYHVSADLGNIVKKAMLVPEGAGQANMGAVFARGGVNALAWQLPNILSGKFVIPLVRVGLAGAARVAGRRLEHWASGSFARHPGEVFLGLADKAAALKGMQNTAQSYQKRIDDVVAGILGVGKTTRRLAIPISATLTGIMGESNPRVAAKKFVLSAARNSADQMKLADNISAATAPFSAHAPNITAQASVKLAENVAKFVRSMPKLDINRGIQSIALAEKRGVSRAEAHEIAEHAMALNEPLEAIAAVAEGRAGSSLMNKVKDYYPMLAQMVILQLTADIGSHPTPIQQKKIDRLAHAGLLASSATATMAPDFVKNSQAGYAQTAQGKPAGQQVSMKGLNDIEDDMFMSPSQRLNSGVPS